MTTLYKDENIYYQNIWHEELVISKINNMKMEIVYLRLGKEIQQYI